MRTAAQGARARAEGISSGARALCPRGPQLPFNKAEYQRKSKPQFITNPSGRSRAAWLASRHLGADSPRDNSSRALDDFQTLL